MGIGAIFILLGVLWLLQLVLASQQAQRFMKRARALRRQGRVAIPLPRPRKSHYEEDLSGMSNSKRVSAACFLNWTRPRSVLSFATGEVVVACRGSQRSRRGSTWCSTW